MDNIKLIYIGLAITLLGIIIASTVAYKGGYVDFITKAHIYGLLMLVLASVLTWGAFVWISNPDEFHVSEKQKVGLVFSILIGVLIWARFSYITADNTTLLKELRK